MSVMVRVSELCWQKQRKIILQDIDFTINRGEVIGIIGPNGAGKTSLLRCIAQLIPDFRGSVTFKGTPILDFNRRQLAKSMAVVAQQSQSIFALSVYDVIRMGLLPHKNMFATDTHADRNQIAQAIEKVGLTSMAEKDFAILSGGEQQRALIARALVQGAELLIMDEPTNHLDVYYQHQIMHLVKDLNITVIMTVHDLNLAAQHCPRLLLLEKGQLVADGGVEEVLNAELLSRVFNLPCVRDTDPYNGLPRVGFHLRKAAEGPV